jgi:peptide/nickel transport system ATP-binding protein
MTPAIELRDVARVFGHRSGLLASRHEVRAVDGVSFSVGSGSCFGIVGESGCGKSTLARMILGLLETSRGDILIEGRRLGDMPRHERARLIQPVFQDPFSSLNPKRRIIDIVGLPLSAQGIDGRERTTRVTEMLEHVGLRADIAGRTPAQLSGGQRQRVAIARALVLRPRIVVCDEPTSALDVSVQAQILNLLADLRREMTLTVVFISHNLAVVEHICDEVAVMYLGRIVERAPVEKLFASPRHPYTRALLDSVLVPQTGRPLPDVGLGDSYPDPSNIPAGCRFHPRCPLADANCATTTPMPRQIGDRLVECLLAAE